MIFDLRDDALMAGALGVGMQQPMELRRSGDGEGAEPEREHPKSSEAAQEPPLRKFRPYAQIEVKKALIW